MTNDRVIVVGAGIGGLVTAVELARRGVAVRVIERAADVGGKMRQTVIGESTIDGGPTVLTLVHIFERIFADAGDDLHARVRIQRADVLARHVWQDGSRFDLPADLDAAETAVQAFAGAREAEGFRRFHAYTSAIYAAVEQPFVVGPKPSPWELAAAQTAGPLQALRTIDPMRSMWRALRTFFRDPRLQQLFGRYATYVGSSPFLTPATLNLVAAVEQRGVWLVDGGIHRLAVALRGLAERLGAEFTLGTEVQRIETAAGKVSAAILSTGERVPADAVVVNGDAAALTGGLLGKDVQQAVGSQARSLSALTWAMVATTEGVPLLRHTVFFGDSSEAEFHALFKQRKLPSQPTIYVCAQDRSAHDAPWSGPERLLVLVNAPAEEPGYSPLSPSEIDTCEATTISRLSSLGLRLYPGSDPSVRTTPSQFGTLFPGSGGALYGGPSHGMLAALRRPGSRTTIPGLYLAGGSCHPGPGVPMVASSGRHAAAAVLADLGSTRQLATTGMLGGT